MIDAKCEKSQKIGHFEFFFQLLLNWSENCLLVTCITSLKRIHEKLFKLSMSIRSRNIAQIRISWWPFKNEWLKPISRTKVIPRNIANNIPRKPLIQIKSGGGKGKIIDVKRENFDYFSAIIKLVRELVIINMHNMHNKE